MRIHKSGDKSMAFFISYMNLLLVSERTSIDDLETYMMQHFFQNGMEAFGPITFKNFKEALQIIQKK